MSEQPTPTAALAALVIEMEEAIPTSLLPHVAKPEQVAVIMQTTVDALAQDRYRRRGLPWTKISGRIRYLRTDVLKALAENRFRAGGAA